MSTNTHRFHIDPLDTLPYSRLCGACNEHIHQIAQFFHIRIRNRGGQFDLMDVKTHDALRIEQLLRDVYAEAAHCEMTPEVIQLHLQALKAWQSPTDSALSVPIKTQRLLIKPRGTHQQLYVNRIRQNDINFGIGPAGTGKTYLAVACAVEALEKGLVERIILVRPAVEAGEKLGFLPGDLAQKVDPYLRPLYDALYDVAEAEQIDKYLEKNIIEIAPLAYMRGRTLNQAFIILDESQNTTREQMKMFLTRMGFGSTAVITGDGSQVDLPNKQLSGLHHAVKLLDGTTGIGVTRFASQDVVRHPLVQRIVEAYDEHEALSE